MACNTRPTIMIGKFIEIAQINEPIVKSTNATKNNFRYEYLLNRYAVIGIKIPFTNMNPVINHCPVDAEILNSVLIFGKATFNNVWFKIAINIPNNNAANILPRETPSPKIKFLCSFFIFSFTLYSSDSGFLAANASSSLLSLNNS